MDRDPALCRVKLKDRKRAKDMMPVLSLNETLDQLAIANRVHWNGHVTRR